MKVSLMCYHKNAESLYPSRWINEFRQSIECQTFNDFNIYEVEYGGGDFRIFENSIYESKEFPTFIHTMNYLIEKALENGTEILGNLNIDDRYNLRWLETQLPYNESGFDIVSPNFSLIRDNLVYHVHHFENLDIKEELNKNHNILCHPCITYSKRFLEENRYIPEEFPEEDLLLWKRTIDHYLFKIVPENLLYHRIHSNSVCQSSNR